MGAGAQGAKDKAQEAKEKYQELVKKVQKFCLTKRWDKIKFKESYESFEEFILTVREFAIIPLRRYLKKDGKSFKLIETELDFITQFVENTKDSMKRIFKQVQSKELKVNQIESKLKKYFNDENVSEGFDSYFKEWIKRRIAYKKQFRKPHKYEKAETVIAEMNRRAEKMLKEASEFNKKSGMHDSTNIEAVFNADIEKQAKSAGATVSRGGFWMPKTEAEK